MSSYLEAHDVVFVAGFAGQVGLPAPGVVAQGAVATGSSSSTITMVIVLAVSGMNVLVLVFLGLRYFRPRR